MKLGWKFHWLKSPSNDIIQLLTFLTNGIQALQQQWEKCVDNKGDYENGLKSSNDDIKSAVDDFFNQWDPSPVTVMLICSLSG